MSDPHLISVANRGLCTCLPYTYSKARPVNFLNEIEVRDFQCPHHGDHK